MELLGAFHVGILLALGALVGHTLLNALRLPRLTRTPLPGSSPPVSVLIPARNETGRIEAAIRAWARQAYPAYEVLIYDDESSDGTAARARRAAEGAAHVRVIDGGPLPAGWRGKPWACHRLAREARGQVLVFADADVLPVPDALARIVSALGTLEADAVSAVPAHASPSRLVQLLAGIQNWAVLAFVPSWLPPRRGGRVVAALNGQLMAVTRAVYEASGGFAAARLALAEDVAFGRHLAALGYRVRLVDGAGVLTCVPYARARQLWQATARNLVPIFFDSPALLFLAMGALAAVHLGPLLVLGGGLLGRAAGLLPKGAGTAWTWLPLVEVGLGMLPRVLADRRAGYPLLLSLLHPLAIAALVGMAVSSVLRFRVSRVVEWRGRRYALADDPGGGLGRAE